MIARFAASYLQYSFAVYMYSIKEYTVSVKCTICLCLQCPVPRHSLDVTVENVSQTHTNVLVLIHAQMAVMKMDVVSASCTQTNAQCFSKSI